MTTADPSSDPVVLSHDDLVKLADHHFSEARHAADEAGTAETNDDLITALDIAYEHQRWAEGLRNLAAGMRARVAGQSKIENPMSSRALEHAAYARNLLRDVLTLLQRPDTNLDAHAAAYRGLLQARDEIERSIRHLQADRPDAVHAALAVPPGSDLPLPRPPAIRPLSSVLRPLSSARARRLFALGGTTF